MADIPKNSLYKYNGLLLVVSIASLLLLLQSIVRKPYFVLPEYLFCYLRIFRSLEITSKCYSLPQKLSRSLEIFKY